MKKTLKGLGFEMKNKKIIFFAIFILTALILYTSRYANTVRYVLTGKAQANSLNLKVALSGNFSSAPNPSYSTKIIFYTREGKAKELSNQILSRDNGNLFKAQVNLDDLDINQPYAVFIKPDKYIGKLFCSSLSSSQNCTIPQINLTAGENTLDLSALPLPAGDLFAQDGKVDSYDISKIIGDIGQISQQDYLESDINQDGIVNTFDYSMTLYSLSQNAADDKPTLVPLPTLTPTALPSVTSVPQPSATIPLAPTATPISTPIPTATLIPTPTTAQVAGGSCNITLNGKIYYKGLMSGCSPVDNEKSNYCVTAQTDCNPTKCHDIAIGAVIDGIQVCGGSWGISLDEQKTQITCTVEFVPGACTPPPVDTSCEDDGKKC